MRTALGKVVSRPSQRLVVLWTKMSVVSLILVLFIVSFFIITTPALAFPWDAQSQSTFTLGNLLKSGLVGLSGTCVDPSGSVQISEKDFKPCSEVQQTGGAISMTTNAMSYLYNPPISSVYYLANLGESLGIGPGTAYAQVKGSGEEVVAPVYRLWQISRNLAYLVFIVVFVVVGFMVMFRQKLNPQTIIGVQQALPGLIIGLILVSFSYFIASLMIDLSFLGIQVVAQYFISAQSPTSPNSLGNVIDLAHNSNIFNLFAVTAFNGTNLSAVWLGTSGQLVQLLGGNQLGVMGLGGGGIGGIAGAVATLMISGPFGIVTGIAGGLAIPVIIPALVCLILLVALFVQMFKLLIALLKAYIGILIMTLAGPFFILAGSIPGKSTAVSGWIKNLLANVLIFPAVFAAFLFAGVILGDTTSWNNTSVLPLFGGLDQNFVRVLIAYGILLGTPGIPDAVKGALGVKDQNPITQAAMAGAGGGWGLTSGAGQKGWKATGVPQYRQSIVDTRNKALASGDVPPTPITGRNQTIRTVNPAYTNWNTLGHANYQVGPPPTQYLTASSGFLSGILRGWLTR
ncbi:MAG: hypothetical protein Q7R97_01320 [Candidatus Daviesbacteria bacterium]|nr:hypothetical protein [Candidatus Daviesbacteria bacterium]